MSKVMVTIRTADDPPTVEGLRSRYHLAADDIDTSFGVVEVDPVEHVYTILVEESAAARIEPDEGWHVAGPFSNPRIQPFGPPEA